MEEIAPLKVNENLVGIRDVCGILRFFFVPMHKVL